MSWDSPSPACRATKRRFASTSGLPSRPGSGRSSTPRRSSCAASSLLVHEMLAEGLVRCVLVVGATEQPEILDRGLPALRDRDNVIEFQRGRLWASAAILVHVRTLSAIAVVDRFLDLSWNRSDRWGGFLLARFDADAELSSFEIGDQ